MGRRSGQRAKQATATAKMSGTTRPTPAQARGASLTSAAQASAMAVTGAAFTARRMVASERGERTVTSGSGASAVEASPLEASAEVTTRPEVEREQAPTRDDDAAEGEGTISLLPDLSRYTPAALLERGWRAARALRLEAWLWIGVMALATFLRFWQLGAKPLHHDESMHAYFSLAWARDPASYLYDPLLHGPFQFHAEGLIFALLLGLQHIFQPNASGNPWITDGTARILPALFGVGIVALPLGLRRELGRWGALTAALLLAVSPAFVYFSRFLREDIYFNFFMFAMVVAAVRFAQERSIKWFMALAAATTLAYATFEGIFLTFAVFGGFLALLLAWELGYSLARALPRTLVWRERVFFGRGMALAALGALGGAVAIKALQTVNALNVYVMGIQGDTQHPPHQSQSDAYVKTLENNSVAVLLWLSIAIAALVIATLLWQMFREESAFTRPDALGADEAPQPQPLAARVDALFNAPGRFFAGLRERVDPDRQPFIYLVLSTSWVTWFVAFVTAWMIFAALYWVVPGEQVATVGDGFRVGIGRGLWQGLYYWIQQQQVARGGQPPYYYLLLLPLYEQIACVFGLVGVVYALRRPTRFRLFLVWWFVMSLAIYSWAGEKMPWLSIQILLPLMLLTAVAVEAVFVQAVATVRRIVGDGVASLREAPIRPAASLLGAALALALLLPTVHGMWTLSQVDPADGPHEMMVYVQTTPDVDLVMRKIQQADQRLYGGTHQLRIGVGPGEEWPIYWYLRDYQNVTYGYQAHSTSAPQVDVAILQPSGDANGSDGQGFLQTHPTGYTMRQYRLRAWWDEAYKPTPCIPTTKKTCPPWSLWGSGVGVGTYLSYGQDGAPNAPFDLGRASSRVWNWLWFRKPLGSTTGSYDFVFVVRNGVPISA